VLVVIDMNSKVIQFSKTKLSSLVTHWFVMTSSLFPDREEFFTLDNIYCVVASKKSEKQAKQH